MKAGRDTSGIIISSFLDEISKAEKSFEMKSILIYFEIISQWHHEYLNMTEKKMGRKAQVKSRDRQAGR